MLIRYIIPTPIGHMEITGSELGVRTAQLCDNRETSADPSAKEVTEMFENHPVAECARQVAEYFAGARKTFDLKLDWGGAPDFQRQVWAELVKIPFGTTVSYSDIAERVGNPAAVRAVGMANRSNPIAIVVPCHRVIGKAGELRGYFYGLDTKMLLLRHENPVRFAQQGELF
ncbi:MAG: methylated-DNA--[protein]-cysteine S-methyltransferase [Phycisphaerae bacterium]|nr:methylated-DNA--[protein]-cysteine S-methyltransferase [Saprospiraceae bacterium]